MGVTVSWTYSLKVTNTILAYRMEHDLVVGFAKSAEQNFEGWARRWKFYSMKELDPLPPMKVFTPKFNLPILNSYEGEAPKEFWDGFPRYKSNKAGGMVDGHKLRLLAEGCGYSNKELLDTVCRDLVEGACIGCKGAFRAPGKAKNAPSALAEGRKVSDAIADWVSKGYARGPFRMDQVPPEAKFNGLMARPKPNGSVRVIMNLSSPKGQSVNDGICSEEFPTSMSSTGKWLEALSRAGRGCKMVKIDWADAYKHLPVSKRDENLQWFSWLGRAFRETRLVFGGASSAGIFDRLNKVVIAIVAIKARMDPLQICQVLDDCCACAPAGSSVLERFDDKFKKVAGVLGIKLAPREDHEKSFAPCTEGVVLGVNYNTRDWTWGIPAEKLCRALHCLDEVASSAQVKQRAFWSLVGKLLHLAPLVPDGKFNLYHLLKANSISNDPDFMVTISERVRSQLKFWRDMLQVCSNMAAIPDPLESLPPWTVEVFTDAAGGTTRSAGRGVGAVSETWWVYLPWGRQINTGQATADGKALDRSMSALELLGPLLGLCAAAKQARGGAFRFWVDNAGSVFIWKKGYSTSCVLSSTLVTAVACVAAGLGCKVDIVKISRCSTPLASMADALSKADFRRFWALANEEVPGEMPLEPLEVPEALMRWVIHPKEDWDLGRRILRDLHSQEPVLGF